MAGCTKCGGLNIVCTATSSCPDLNCKDCGKIAPCPVCRSQLKIVKKPEKSGGGSRNRQRLGEG